jgi:GTP-binding protein
VIDVPEEYSGKAIELVTQRRGDLHVMEPKGDLQHLEFDIPARGIIGLRNHVLTATAGEAVMTHRFRAFEPFKGEISGRMKGALISMETGQSTAYEIDRLQDRGRFFVDPGEQIYKGQVIGEHTRENDLELNVIRGKKLTNMRASGTDDNARIAPKIQFSLEESMEYIREDEYLEVTPQSLRMRKIPK